MKLHTIFFSFVTSFLTIFSAFAQTTPQQSSVLVCRGHQCALAEYSMTREFLFNKLTDLFEQNIGHQILLCEADPNARVCSNNALELVTASRLVPAYTRIPSAAVVDAKLNGNLSLDLILDFNVIVNKTKPKCQTAATRLSIPFVDKLQMQVTDFGCDLTASGNTKINMNYQIDFVDFDYGVLGAYYTLGFGEVFRGGKTGYMLFRFTEREMTSQTVPQETPILTLTEPVVKKSVPVRSYSVKEERFVNGKKVSETLVSEPDIVLAPIDFPVNSGVYMPVISKEMSEYRPLETEPDMYRGILTPAQTHDRIESSCDHDSCKKSFWDGVLNVIYLGN